MTLYPIKKGIKKIISSFFLQQEYWRGAYLIRKSHHLSPSFLIIGAPKAGTTSLFQYLTQHPKILSPKEKEILYFSAKQYKGLKWYLNHFPKKAIEHLTFEATPSYMYYKKGLKRIKHLFPDVKLIIILRNPIKRAFSQWNFNQEGSSYLLEHPFAIDKRTFKVAIQEELDGLKIRHPLHKYLYRSEYPQHLANVYQYFDKQQVLVLDFEELKNQPQKVLAEVTAFLQIENVYNRFKKSEERLEGLLQTKDHENKNELKTYNANPYKEKIDKETEALLKAYFEPFDKEIVRLTGRTFSWMEPIKQPISNTNQ